MSVSPRPDGWFFADGKRAVGPLPIDELSRRLEAGPAPGDVLVWRPGLTDWTRAKDIDDLAGLFVGLPPASVEPQEPSDRRNYWLKQLSLYGSIAVTIILSRASGYIFLIPASLIIVSCFVGKLFRIPDRILLVVAVVFGHNVWMLGSAIILGYSDHLDIIYEGVFAIGLLIWIIVDQNSTIPLYILAVYESVGFAMNLWEMQSADYPGTVLVHVLIRLLAAICAVGAIRQTRKSKVQPPRPPVPLSRNAA